MIFGFIVIVTAVFLWYLNDFYYYREYPPGPTRFPIIGNFFQVLGTSRRTFEAFTRLSEKYGDVMSIRLGSTDYIVLSNPYIFHDIQKRQGISDRNEIDVEYRNMNKNFGITWASGENWKNTKNLVIQCFRKFGFLRSTDFEVVVLDEFQKLREIILREVEGFKNGDLKLKPLFEVFTLNIVWKFATGRQFSYEDSHILHVLSWSDKQLQSMALGKFTNVFPLLRRMLKSVDRRICPEEKLHQFMKEQIKINEATKIKNTENQNFVDLFLQEMLNGKRRSILFNTEDNLILTMLDIFQGGTLGPSGTLNFAIWYIMLNPKVQQKIQNEIDENIPTNHVLSLADKARMPFTEAAILEIFRLGTVFPIPIARKVQKDFKYNGLLFRKGVLVIPNFGGVMQNKSIWGDPENFRPERFLKPNGKIDKNLSDFIVPFGHGERRCLGDRLAPATIFLTLVSLLREFTFSTVVKGSIGSTQHQYGMAMSPYPYYTRICLRNPKPTV